MRNTAAQQHLIRSVHRVWLAGLGALVRAQQEGRGDLFQDLVERGEALEARAEAAPRVEGAYDLSPLGSWEVAEPGVATGATGWSSGVAAEGREMLAYVGPLLERLAEQRDSTRRLIDSMLPAAVPTAPAVLQARRNASAREALLAEFGLLSSAEVADLAGSRARNKAALANRWKQEGRAFTVTHQGQALFPAFQLDGEGQPRPVIAEVLAALGAESGDWELALWFIAANGWLGGRRPVDLLESDPAAVAAAARHEATDLVY